MLIRTRAFVFGAILASSTITAVCTAGEPSSVSDFHNKVQPILKEYCYDCHGEGASKGGIAYDELKSDDQILNRDLWLKVLKNTRAGLMPPLKKPRPSPEQQQALETWIKYE